VNIYDLLLILGGLTSLQLLVVRHDHTTSVTIAATDAFSKLPLKSLHLRCYDSGRQMTQLRGLQLLTSLTTFVCSNSTLDPESLASISASPMLQNVYFDRCYFLEAERALEHLPALQSLRYLGFHWPRAVDRIAEGKWTHGVLDLAATGTRSSRNLESHEYDFLQRMPQLTTLVLLVVEFASYNFANLRALMNLRELVIQPVQDRNFNLSDVLAALDHLASLPSLLALTLDLERKPMPTAVIEPLNRNFKRLLHLRIRVGFESDPHNDLIEAYETRGRARLGAGNLHQAVAPPELVEFEKRCSVTLCPPYGNQLEPL